MEAEKGEDALKLVFRKNQVVLTLLAVMLAAAGYLNYVNRDEKAAAAEAAEEKLLQENQEALEGQTQEETESEPGTAPGKAVFTNAEVMEFISAVSLEKKELREANKAVWQEIIDNEDLEPAQKAEAVEAMVHMTEIEARELAAETLLASSGFEHAIVSITNDKVDIVLGMAEISDAQRAQVEDIVKRKTEIGVENMYISLMKKQN